MRVLKYGRSYNQHIHVFQILQIAESVDKALKKIALSHHVLIVMNREMNASIIFK